MLFLAAISSNTFAQQQPGNGPGPDDQKMMGREITPENFSEMKTRMLTMIEKRRTWLDTEKACVEAAKSADELKKCRPERPMGGWAAACIRTVPDGSRGPGQAWEGSSKVESVEELFRTYMPAGDGSCRHFFARLESDQQIGLALTDELKIRLERGDKARPFTPLSIPWL